MKRSKSILLASSVFWLAVTVAVAQRPHYGGTLRISLKEVPQALDPATLAASGSANLSPLIFETLTRLDDRGRPQPLLATSWQSEPGNQRWRISLRSGVSFHDGLPLDAASIVASLRANNPEWKVVSIAEMVMIETSSPEPLLPLELALTRNAIVHRNADTLSGTGPFSIGDWVPGKHLTLQANPQYWNGPPFVDSIEFTFGVNDREQLLALDLGKADVIEIAPEMIRRARAEGRTVSTSEPAELMALEFSANAQSQDDVHLRNAFVAALDKDSLGDVVLQGGGAPAAGLLPDWLSGYEFALPQDSEPEFIRRERDQIHHAVNWTLSCDSSDPIARVVAERILLNARDAGIVLQLVTSDTADIKLIRFPLASSDPDLALSDLAKTSQLTPPKLATGSIQELYATEKNLLQSHRVIPLLHLRSALAVGGKVRDLSITPDGRWEFDNVWLAPEKP